MFGRLQGRVANSQGIRALPGLLKVQTQGAGRRQEGCSGTITHRFRGAAGCCSPLSSDNGLCCCKQARSVFVACESWLEANPQGVLEFGAVVRDKPATCRQPLKLPGLQLHHCNFTHVRPDGRGRRDSFPVCGHRPAPLATLSAGGSLKGDVCNG